MKNVCIHCTVLDLIGLLGWGHALPEILRSKMDLKTAKLELKYATCDLKRATAAAVWNWKTIKCGCTHCTVLHLIALHCWGHALGEKIMAIAPKHLAYTLRCKQNLGFLILN